MGARKTIVYAVSDAVTAEAFLEGHLRHSARHGWEVILVASPSPLLHEIGERCGVRVIPIVLPRSITPLHDLRALAAATRVLRRLHPQVTHVGTPKAGLVVGVAAWLARVPVRIYTLHGLRLETASGLERVKLWMAERTACAVASSVVPVSQSVRAKAVALRLVQKRRACVLGGGSISGVAAERFADSRLGEAFRDDHDIDRDAPVVAFVGRLVRDKGVEDLLEAWAKVRSVMPAAVLVMVGSEDPTAPLRPETLSRLKQSSVVRTGQVADSAPALLSCDIVVLPSYREGMPTVLLEAAAAGKAVVAYRATGSVDAVIDGVTGWLTPVGDPKALADAVIVALADGNERIRRGEAGRLRVRQHFDPRDRLRDYDMLYSGAFSAIAGARAT